MTAKKIKNVRRDRGKVSLTSRLGKSDAKQKKQIGRREAGTGRENENPPHPQKPNLRIYSTQVFCIWREGKMEMGPLLRK